MNVNLHLGIAAGLGILSSLLLSANIDAQAALVIGTTCSMAYLWVTACIPIYVTALLPLVIFPFAGIIPMKELASSYMSDVVLLFVGGFLMAFAIENCGLHKRIALKIIAVCSASYSKILLGFMIASAFLSMWILNTATVAMLLPAVLAVLHQMGKSGQKMAAPLLLGIAYASSIGGMATIVGTLPNAIAFSTYNDTYINEPELSFFTWMQFALPLAIILITVTFFVLKAQYMKGLGSLPISIDESTQNYKALGPMSYQEKVVGILFVLMAFLWITMKEIDFGVFQFSGWSNFAFIPEPSYIKESTIAIMFGVVLMIYPMPKNKALLTWKDAEKMPIGIIFLFGAGFALKEVFVSSGVDSILGQELIHITKNLSPFLIVLLLCLVMTFLTELTSNTTSLQLFILIIIAVGASHPEIEPLFLLLPVTFCASCAFMLPVATPPNTIVYGSGKIDSKTMLRSGLILNVLSVIIITCYCYIVV